MNVLVNKSKTEKVAFICFHLDDGKITARGKSKPNVHGSNTK